MSTRQPAGLRILVAEDDGMIAEAICERLTEAGYEVVGRAETGVGALEAALALHPDLVLMDVRLKGELDGVRASELINDKVRVPVVYLTGDLDRKTLERAKSASAYGYVLKPFHIKNLIGAIEVAIDRFQMERRLEDSQLTHAAILDSVTEAVLAVDTGGRVRFMNRVAERLTGWSTREAEQGLLERVLHLEYTPYESVADLTSRALSSPTALSLGPHACVRSREGVRVPVDGAMSCVIDPSGRLVGASLTLRDVTHIRKAESDLRAMANQLRAVIDTAVDGVLMLDAGRRILMVNPACEHLFGYASRDMIGRTIEILMPTPFPDAEIDGVQSDSATARSPVKVRARATTCCRRDGSTFPAEISLGEATHAGRPLLVCVVHDVSERRNLEAALVGAVAREQHRFGRDLHDGLGQELTGLSLLLSALRDAAEANQTPHAADLERALEIARHALASCQAIARGLSPVEPANGGLVPALRDLVSRLKSSSGPSLAISVSEVANLGLSPAASDHLFRIAQEALANALRHAHASAINLSLEVEPTAVRLKICDDGEGLTLTELGAKGLGLRTMRYRASLLGATFRITRVAPAGTCVICECPRAA